MANITQELGFDVQKALASLDSLNKSISSFNRRIGSLGKTLNRFNTAGNAAAAVFNNVNTASGSVQQGLNSATKSTERLTVSWQLLSRVVVTQLIVRALRRVQAAFGDAAKESITLGTRIEEIQTIAGGAFGNSERLTQTVRQLSDEFGNPILDTAAGLYQTISNQIGRGADEQIRFLRAVQTFAKVGVASVRDSTNLLSGTLNAFGKSVLEVNKVSSQFFKTIELGRTTASELATSFGRLPPFAQALGVSLAETQGVLASLTIRGLKTSEAVTQIRGVMNALLKPSQAMRAALERLGFSSGELAVRTLTLTGVLRELRATGANFTELFPRIRARAGAEAIAKTADEVEETTRKIAEADRNLTNLKFAEFIQADSQQAVIELNKFKNFFVTEVGPPIVRGLLVFGRGLRTIGGEISGLRDTPLRAAFRELDESLTLTGRNSELFRAKLEAEFLKAEKATDNSIRNIRKGLRDLNSQFIEAQKDVDFADRQFSDATSRRVNQTIRDRERLVNVVKRQLVETLRLQDASKQRVLDIGTSQSDRRFEFDLRGLSQVDQFESLLTKARQEAGKAGELFSKAADPKVAQQITQQFQRAIQFADRARQAAISSGDRTAEEDAVRQINSLLNKQVAFEERLQKIQGERAANLQREQVLQEKRNEQLREAGKLLLANLKATDAQGQPLSGEALARQQRNQRKALEDFQSAAFQQRDISTADILGITRLTREINADLERRPIKLNVDVQEGFRDQIQRVQRLAEASQSQIRLAIDPESLSIIERFSGGGRIQNVNDLQRGLTLVQQNITQARQANAELAETRRQVEAIQGELPKVLGAVPDLSDRVSRIIKTRTRGFEEDDTEAQQSRASLKLAKDLDVFTNSLRAVSKDGNVTSEQVKTLTASLVELTKRASEDGPAGIGAIKDQLVDLTRALASLNQLANLQKSISTTETQFNIRGVNEAQTALAAVASQLRFLKENPNVQVTINALIRGQNQLDRILSGQEPAPSGRAHGGPTQGSDTINALLSPGETVVNARQSRRHFAMLQALNADQRLRLNHGGAVTNVGDVTVNVNESSSPRMTARAVASELRREFRRGTSKL